MGEGADHDRRRPRAAPRRPLPALPSEQGDGAASGGRRRRAHAPGPGPGRHGPSSDRAQPLGRVRWSCATARSSARARPSRPGGAHAEIEALRAAGDRARGATVFTTLEPCSHQGRTGPCVVALAEAGVTRVVVALEDPDPQVAGRGIAQLRDRGITVDVGVGADAAARALAPVPPAPPPRSRLRGGQDRDEPRRPHRRPRRLVAVDHRRRGPGRRPLAARRLAGRRGRRRHRARRPSRASPPATCEPPVRQQPLRVLLDATGRVPADGPLFDPDLAPTLVVTTDAAPDAAHARLARRGRQGAHRAARRRPAPASISPPPSRCSAGSGCSRRWSKAARALSGSLVEAGLADRLVTYVAPTMLGRDGRPALDLAGPDRIADAPRWRLVDVARVGTDVRLDYEPPSPEQPADVHRHRRGARHRARGHPQRRWRAHRDRRARSVLDDAELGASIAVNGCCLTVVELRRRRLGGRRGHRDPRPHRPRRAARRRPGQPRAPRAPRRPPRRPRRAGPRRRRRHRRAPAPRCPTARPA